MARAVQIVPGATPHPAIGASGTGMVPIPPDLPQELTPAPSRRGRLTWLQSVLTDRSAMPTDRDHGVLSTRTWRLADLGAKRSMLLAGLGWGNMPAYLVADDISRGRLKIIRPAACDTQTAKVVMSGACLADRMLGPAGRWMVEHLYGAGE